MSEISNPESVDIIPVSGDGEGENELEQQQGIHTYILNITTFYINSSVASGNERALEEDPENVQAVAAAILADLMPISPVSSSPR
jgi:hypothetical protein